MDAVTGSGHLLDDHFSPETMEVDSSSDVQVWRINVRSPKLPGGQVSVPVMPDNDLGSIVGFVNDVLGEDGGTDLEFTKLIIKGKVLNYASRVKDVLSDGSTVLLMFSSKKDIEAMRKAEKVDHRIRTIEEEDEIQRKRVERSSTAFNSFWGEDQDPTYRFLKFETVSRFSTPHPYDAEKLLVKLATDPGIKKIMKANKWTVGLLAEMDPKSDMIALRKEQEGSCLLGYNENAGHKIYLRLRTDDELEFRGYDGLINTLIHELTHNVRGPHDEEFWRVFGELKGDYLRFHETEYRQGRAGARRVINSSAKVTQELRNAAGNTALSQSERSAARSLVTTKPTEEPKQFLPTRLGASNSRARIQEREKLAKAAEARLAASAKSDLGNACACGDPNHVHTAAVSRSSLSSNIAETSVAKLSESQPIAVLANGSTLDARASINGALSLPLEQDTKDPGETTTLPGPLIPADLVSDRRYHSDGDAIMSGESDKAYVEPSLSGFDDAYTSDREKRLRQATILLCRYRNEAGAKLVHAIVKNALSGDAKFRKINTTSDKFKRLADSNCKNLLEAVGFEINGSHYVLTRYDPGLLILATMLLEESRLVV